MRTDATRQYPRGARTRRKRGLRYETCAGCGLEWNVSRLAPLGWYVCPECRGDEYGTKKNR